MANIEKSQNPWAYFNGSSSYIQYADADIFSFTDGVNDIPFEIEFDVMITSTMVTNYIISKRDGSSTFEWLVTFSNNAIKIGLYTTTSANYITQICNTALVLNQSYNVKISYDGSKNISGLKIYVNRVLQSTTSGTGGSYTGMLNLSASVYVGKLYSSTGYFNGYLRNLKITKNNQLVFFAPLQDTNAVSKDVIGGLVHNAGTLPIVVNYLERERWAYFDGVNSVASIGTTSTLGWMNNGVFRMELDVIPISITTGHMIFSTSTTTGHHGFRIFLNTSNRIQLYWYAGGAAQGLTLITGFIIGVQYNLIVRADGINIYYTLTGSDGSINTNEPTGFAITFVAFATTTTIPNIGSYNNSIDGTYNINAKIKNFKIFTDTAGTIPFLSLPFQNPDAIDVDTVGGLVGTNTNVRLVDNMENVLKSQNNWSSFDGSSTYISYADNDIFSFTDGVNDLPFEIEFDLMPIKLVSIEQYVLVKGTSGKYEWIVKIQSSVLKLYCTGPTGGIAIGISTPISNNTSYHVKLTYDGLKLWTGLKIYFGNVLQTLTNISAGIYVGMTNDTGTFNIGRIDSIVSFGGYLRNLKITKSNQLVFFTPLQDTTAVSKDVIGGLVHNAGVLPTVVNYLERENWAYFNSTTSLATIGTTSTLGWINSGVFNMEFEIKFNTLNSSNQFIVINGSSSLSSYGFLVSLSINSLYLYWRSGSADDWVQTSVITTGVRYKVIFQGNGTQLRRALYNLDTGVYNYDSGFVNKTFVPNATTTNALTFNHGDAGGSYNIRNFKIFTDTAGTIPFMSLPMQDAPTLMTDRVTGLQGTATNVSIINNNENVLRYRDLWSYFDGLTSTATMGTTSTLGWMNSGVFRMEFDIKQVVYTAAYYIRNASTTLTSYGFHFIVSSNNIVFRWTNGSGSYGANITGGIIVTGTNYRFTAQGNGTQIRYVQYDLDTGTNLYDSGWIACTYIPNATTTAALLFASPVGANIQLRNFKIFTDTDGTIPFMLLPMQDGGNIMRDVIGGLQGTATNIKVIET
jgi:hypothetical protein